MADFLDSIFGDPRFQPRKKATIRAPVGCIRCDRTYDGSKHHACPHCYPKGAAPDAPTDWSVERQLGYIREHETRWVIEYMMRDNVLADILEPLVAARDTLTTYIDALTTRREASRKEREAKQERMIEE